MAEGWDRFRFPEQFFAEILKQNVREEIATKDENPTIFHTALVLAVDTVGGKLENPDGNGNFIQKVNGKNVTIKANVNPKNPRNSIKARILSDGFDQFIGDSDLRVFYPAMPEHISFPIKPGEHVLVFFTDSEYSHGLWLGKSPGHENVNYKAGENTFVKDSENSLSSKFPDLAAVQNSSDTDLATDEAASESFIKDNSLTSLFS